jgi:hypothetical protein
MRLHGDFVDAAASDGRAVAQEHTPLWKLAFAFIVGFSLQFDMYIGGNGQGAAATGGYGYRLTDFLSVAAVGLLTVHALLPRRLIALAVFAGLIGAMAAIRIIDPTFWDDPRTGILGLHYIAYSFAGLYVAINLSSGAALGMFCWGLIVGLLATIPIYVLQDAGWSANLIQWGFASGFARTFDQLSRDMPRLSGITGHPNEAGHVAALATAAGTYFALLRRGFWPLILVAGGVLATFYYTWSRGGLIASALILAVPFVYVRGRAALLRIGVTAGILIAAVALLSQLDFVSSRFGDDPNATDNMAQRLESILAGFQVLMMNPFGMSINEFISLVAAGSGGVASPHNGFLFFGGVFGLLPLFVLISAFAMNLRVRTDQDIFFALLTLQICVSFLFEQLPGSLPYVFVMCVLVARAYLRTQIGGELLASSSPGTRGTLAIGRSRGSASSSL